MANYCPFSISAIFFLHCFLQFSSTLKGNKLWYKGFPDNMVLIRMVPGLARIPLFNTVFIRKCHFLLHKTQIKPPNISASHWTYLLQILSKLCFQRVVLSGNYEIVAISTDKNTFLMTLIIKLTLGNIFIKVKNPPGGATVTK